MSVSFFCLPSTTNERPATSIEAEARAIADELDAATGVRLADLPAHGCRFAVTPHEARSHRFCGAAAVPGQSYCARHMAVTHVGTRTVYAVGERVRLRADDTAGIVDRVIEASNGRWFAVALEDGREVKTRAVQLIPDTPDTSQE